jgi:DNA-directed RNA polymerase specialized sigma24 family protein
MPASETDASLEALPDDILRHRLARTNWTTDPAYISNEQIFRLLHRARQAGNQRQVETFASALCRRLLSLAKGFVVRSGIYPGIIGNHDQAAEELSQYVWDCLLKRPGDATHAEKCFGQLFKCRGIDFQRQLLAKKRKCQDSLDALDHSSDDDDTVKDTREANEVRQENKTFDALASKQEYALLAARLQSVLTKNEHSAYVMLHVEEMQVKEIAVAMGVTTKTVNNYKNAAIEKIRKEFKP